MRNLKTSHIDVGQVTALTLEQAKARYNIGTSNLFKIADKAEANIRIGKKRLYSRSKLDKYFEDLADY